MITPDRLSRLSAAMVLFEHLSLPVVERVAQFVVGSIGVAAPAERLAVSEVEVRSGCGDCIAERDKQPARGPVELLDGIVGGEEPDVSSVKRQEGAGGMESELVDRLFVPDLDQGSEEPATWVGVLGRKALEPEQKCVYLRRNAERSLDWLRVVEA
jgi:hypothetical protein